MKTPALVFVCLLLVSTAFAQHTIQVKIDNVEDRKGNLMIALCNTAKNFLEASFRIQMMSVPAQGEITANFTDVPQGVYAIRIFHDQNVSGKLEYGLMGIPKEAVGFSKNPKMQFGPPNFDEVSFEVNQNRSEVIRMRNFKLF